MSNSSKWRTSQSCKVLCRSIIVIEIPATLEYTRTEKNTKTSRNENTLPVDVFSRKLDRVCICTEPQAPLNMKKRNLSTEQTALCWVKPVLIWHLWQVRYILTRTFQNSYFKQNYHLFKVSSIMKERNLAAEQTQLFWVKLAFIWQIWHFSRELSGTHTLDRTTFPTKVSPIMKERNLSADQTWLFWVKLALDMTAMTAERHAKGLRGASLNR